MAKSKITSKDTKKQEPITLTSLSNLLFELHDAEWLLKECCKADMKIDCLQSILQLLIRVSVKKIEYWEKKYNLKVPETEIFYVEEIMDFVRAKEAYATGGEV